MVNIVRIACGLALAGLASSEATASSSAKVPPGVTAPTGVAPSGQTGAPSIAPPDSLPPLSLLGSKREAQQSPPPQVQTSVGPPLTGPIPTATAIASDLPQTDVSTVTRRATGLERRQKASSSPVAPTSSNPLSKPSGVQPSAPPPSALPASSLDVTVQKFTKLPPNFNGFN